MVVAVVVMIAVHTWAEVEIGEIHKHLEEEEDRPHLAAVAVVLDILRMVLDRHPVPFVHKFVPATRIYEVHSTAVVDEVVLSYPQHVVETSSWRCSGHQMWMKEEVVVGHTILHLVIDFGGWYLRHPYLS